LLLPSVFAVKALTPTPVLLSPVVMLSTAPLPKPILLLAVIAASLSPSREVAPALRVMLSSGNVIVLSVSVLGAISVMTPEPDALP